MKGNIWSGSDVYTDSINNKSYWRANSPEEIRGLLYNELEKSDISIPFTITGETNVNAYIFNSKWEKRPELLNDKISSSMSIENWYFLGRGDKDSYKFIGLERSGRNSEFKNIIYQPQYGYFKFIKQDDILSESDKDDSEIWSEYTQEYFKDILDVIDKKQKDIIQNASRTGLVHINGLAGTGKTVIANEIVWRDNDYNILALYPSSTVKKKSWKFFRSFGVDKRIRVYTYEEFDIIVQREREKHIKNMDAIKGEILKIIPWIEGNTLKHINIIELARLAKKNGTYLKYSDAVSIIDNQALGREYERSSSIDLIVQGYIGAYEAFLLDEAPMSNYFYDFLKAGKYTVMSFDSLQHREVEINNVHEHILRIVYRTTKEIFGFAMKFLDADISYEANITMSDSLTFTAEATFENIINISDILMDASSIVGTEWESLSINLDAKPQLNKNLYIAFSRAIRNLNLFGEYVNEYKEWANE